MEEELSEEEDFRFESYAEYSGKPFFITNSNNFSIDYIARGFTP